MHESEHTYKHALTGTHKHARTECGLCACSTHAEPEQTRVPKFHPEYSMRGEVVAASGLFDHHLQIHMQSVNSTNR